MTSKGDKLLAEMRSHANHKNVDGMARFGIVTTNALGLTTPYLRSLAKEHRGDHPLALELWKSGVFEARALAAMIADPKKISRREMDAWAKQFDNWAICDGVCIHLFRKSPSAHAAAQAWRERKEEFVRRAGFTMMATLAVHDIEANDSVFKKYLTMIKLAARDDRNGVKKAVNWALRQIGKRNKMLNAAAIRTAEEIRKQPSSCAKWIAADALRELRSVAVQRRLNERTLSYKKVLRKKNSSRS